MSPLTSMGTTRPTKQSYTECWTTVKWEMLAGIGKLWEPHANQFHPPARAQGGLKTCIVTHSVTPTSFNENIAGTGY